MKKLAFFFLVFFVACTAQQEEVQIPLIPEDQMILLIADLATADAMVELEALPTNKIIYQKKMSFYKGIFEKHEVSQEEFEQSFLVYSRDLVAFDLMYDKVLEELSLRELNLLKEDQDE